MNVNAHKGFTIIELMAVIVVIAILAAITLVTYNGVVQRSNDTKRKADLRAMQQALARYQVANGSFPTTAPNPGNSTWELSSDPEFLKSLTEFTGASVFAAPGENNTLNLYAYHSFSAGSYGCPVAAGPFYVLWIKGMQTQVGTATVETNSCPGQTLFPSANLNDPKQYIYFGFPSI